MKAVTYFVIVLFVSSCVIGITTAFGTKWLMKPRVVVGILVLVTIVLGVAAYYAEPWCNDYGDICP